MAEPDEEEPSVSLIILEIIRNPQNHQKDKNRKSQSTPDGQSEGGPPRH